MRTILLSAFVLAAATLRAADTAPDWVQELSSRDLPAYPKDVHSVTLLDEAHLSVNVNGQVDDQFRQAVRIVTIEGRRDAVAAIPYLKGAGKIKDFHAWLVSPNGFVKAYGKESAIDVALKEDFALYEDYRMRIIEARNPEVGATFAWSAELEEPSFLPQGTWDFQDREPVLLSRCILTLPAGWTANASTFNHAGITPAVDGTTYTWQPQRPAADQKGTGQPEACLPGPASRHYLHTGCRHFCCG